MRCCRRNELFPKRAIAPPWSSCLRRPSSLVRQREYPCRNYTLTQPAFPYIFSSALRAAGRSMEAALSSCAWHSYTVNMLFTSPVGSPSSTTSSGRVMPIVWLEGRHRGRLRSAMGGCFQCLVVKAACACVMWACHADDGLASPSLRRRLA